MTRIHELHDVTEQGEGGGGIFRATKPLDLHLHHKQDCVALRLLPSVRLPPALVGLPTKCRDRVGVANAVQPRHPHHQVQRGRHDACVASYRWGFGESACFVLTRFQHDGTTKLFQ